MPDTRAAIASRCGEISFRTPTSQRCIVKSSG